MSKLLFLALILASLSLTVKAQEAVDNKEREDIRKVVETYLYSEEPEERKSTLYPQAKIFSVNPDGNKVVETPVSKPAKKLPGRVKTNSRQKIVGIDITDDGAYVKVETDLSSDAGQFPKHRQYLSLLKIGGEWKIVSILMPPIKISGAPAK